MRAMSLLLVVALGTAALLAVRLARVHGRHAAQLSALAGRVGELSARVDAAEQDVAQALTHARVAGALLVEKGVADEEDVEATRRRVDEGGEPAARSRAGDLH
jgi:outer membrane murein-binding lipoprotein Lpp